MTINKLIMAQGPDFKKNENARFYGGTSGLVLPYKNKGYYPLEFQDKSRLHFYGSLFNSIEINSSFYKIPQASTVGRWAESVPDSFKFTFKLWQGITHNKDGNLDKEKIDQFIATINEVGDKIGCLIIQYPPSLRYDHLLRVKELIELVAGRQDSHGWNIAIEFRHNSWYREETFDLLNKYNTALVYHDKKGTQSPLPPLNANFIYLRFHGPRGDYRDSYDDSLLYEYAGYIREWLNEGKDVYCYFNNTIGDAIGNLKSLEKYVYSD